MFKIIPSFAAENMYKKGIWAKKGVIRCGQVKNYIA